MSAPVWCQHLASSFWKKVGGPPPPFPRDLRHLVPAVGLNVVDLPCVSVAAVERWFERLGLPVRVDAPDRSLRACLVAWHGEGFAFLDARDTVAERSFSLAHELGHFLRDYLWPRDTAAARLGATALEVLDGLRPPSVEERLHGILRNVPIGTYVHLLHRDGAGRPLTFFERNSESAADRLAFELLAPAAAVGVVEETGELIDRLVRVFGLPPGPAEDYAAILSPVVPPLDSAIARLLRQM